MRTREELEDLVRESIEENRGKGVSDGELAATALATASFQVLLDIRDLLTSPKDSH